MCEHDPRRERDEEITDADDHARRFAWICDGCVLVTRTSESPKVSDVVDAWPLAGPDDYASVDDELIRHRFRRIGAWTHTLLGPSLSGNEHVYPCAVVVKIGDEDDPDPATDDAQLAAAMRA